MREEDLPIDIYYNKLLGKASIFVPHFCTNLTSKIMRKFSLSCSKVTTKHQNSISECLGCLYCCLWTSFCVSRVMLVCFFDFPIFKIAIKGCAWMVLFSSFVSAFFFHQMIALEKLWKMLFISSFHTFQSQKDNWKWNNSWCH